MKNILSLLLVLLIFHVLPAYSKSEGELSQGMVNPGHQEHPAWFKVSFLDLFEDIEDAANDDKRLMVYYFQDGSTYCKILL